MARYKQLLPRGVLDTDSGQAVYPFMFAAWREYQAWLKAGNVTDPPAVDNRYPTVQAKRDEMLARLDTVLERRKARFMVVGASNTWRITPQFVSMVTLVRQAGAVPVGFTLPNSDRVQVPLTDAQLLLLMIAIRNRLRNHHDRHATLVAEVLTSSDPMTVDIEGGWLV